MLINNTGHTLSENSGSHTYSSQDSLQISILKKTNWIISSSLNAEEPIKPIKADQNFLCQFIKPIVSEHINNNSEKKDN